MQYLILTISVRNSKLIALPQPKATINMVPKNSAIADLNNGLNPEDSSEEPNNLRKSKPIFQREVKKLNKWSGKKSPFSVYRHGNPRECKYI